MSSTRTPIFGMHIYVPIAIGTNIIHAFDIVYIIFSILNTLANSIILGHQLFTFLYALIDIDSCNLSVTPPIGHTKIIPTMYGYQVKATYIYQEAVAHIFN